MGYTTTFKGKFIISRVVDPKIDSFLTAIESDYSIIPILADWLEEQQNEKSIATRTCKTYQEIHNLFHALSPEHKDYLLKFSDTRRMKRDGRMAKALPDTIRISAKLPLGTQAEYFVGGDYNDYSIIDRNRPPVTQPSLWCQWIPNEDGSAIVWDQGEKFYDYIKWISYLVKHFLQPWGYFLNGKISYQGELKNDKGIISIENNIIVVDYIK